MGLITNIIIWFLTVLLIATLFGKGADLLRWTGSAVRELFGLVYKILTGIVPFFKQLIQSIFRGIFGVIGWLLRGMYELLTGRSAPF